MSDLRRENWLSRLCGGGLLLIACLACAILLGLNTFYTVVIADGYNEQVTIIPGVARGLTLLALTVLLTIGAAFLPKKELLF